ncbi:hypothetical protein M3667_06485 [Microbacterium sp. P26]|uniref:hypothetical protein n=1 Tax=Microbacterium TaxID=33882 RepID=UPI00203C9333|nr:hypothetical protein [Microbacterium sp. P26]MCM3501528.1 hypothetical protein [Microbacterium sp. P26]
MIVEQSTPRYDERSKAREMPEAAKAGDEVVRRMAGTASADDERTDLRETDDDGARSTGSGEKLSVVLFVTVGSLRRRKCQPTTPYGPFRTRGSVSAQGVVMNEKPVDQRLAYRSARV